MVRERDSLTQARDPTLMLSASGWDCPAGSRCMGRPVPCLPFRCLMCGRNCGAHHGDLTGSCGRARSSQAGSQGALPHWVLHGPRDGGSWDLGVWWGWAVQCKQSFKTVPPSPVPHPEGRFCPSLVHPRGSWASGQAERLWARAREALRWACTGLTLPPSAQLLVPLLCTCVELLPFQGCEDSPWAVMVLLPVERAGPLCTCSCAQ